MLQLRCEVGSWGFWGRPFLPSPTLASLTCHRFVLILTLILILIKIPILSVINPYNPLILVALQLKVDKSGRNQILILSYSRSFTALVHSISVWKTKLNKHILMGRAIFWSSEIHKIVFCRFDKQVCDRWKASGWLDIVFKGLVPAFWEPWWHFICLFVVALNFLSNLDYFFSKGPARAFWEP